MQQDEIFFKSDEHKRRFLTIIRQFNKVDEGRIDPEYGAALYLFTSEEWLWNRATASGHIAANSLKVEDILHDIDLSHGYEVLVRLAGNLFNGHIHIDPVEFVILDDANIELALSAIKIRVYGFRVTGK